MTAPYRPYADLGWWIAMLRWLGEGAIFAFSLFVLIALLFLIGR